MPKQTITSHASVRDLEIDNAMRTAARFAKLGNVAKAAPIYQRILERDPNHAGAQAKLAELAFKTSAFEIAIGLAQRAYASDPTGPYAFGSLVILGQGQQVMRQPAASAAAFRRAIALKPLDAVGHVGLGTALLDLDDRPAALRSFRLATELDPENLHARHMADSLGEAGATGNTDYVRDLFDDYASYFDQQLTGKLGYRAPTDMRRAVTTAVGDRRFELGLDLGCGTGLVAEAFRDVVDAMDGIDLSPRMIEAARAKGIYRNLHVAEIVDHLAQSTVRYDLVTSCDTFIYVGDLAPSFAQVALRLVPGGVFAFSFEEVEGTAFTVRSSARFAHARGYIAELAETHGLDLVALTDIVVRTDNSLPIPGAIAVLQRRG